MAETCFSLVRGKAMRVTRLDACGNPVPGPHSVVVSKGFISVGLTASTDTGTEITVVTANGETCVRDTPDPKFQGYTAEIQFCGVDPRSFELMTGQHPVLDDNSDVIGFGMDTDTSLGDSGFALELWSAIPADQCGAAGKEYGYILLPFFKGGSVGDFTVGNDAVNFTVSGAQTKDGNGWGVGPYNVTKTKLGVASPLFTSISANRHLLVMKALLAPPVDQCGGQALGVPATTITAGIPATLTPSNSYAPASLAALTASGVTKSPTTAWTTGQYVELQDGSYAHWTGSAWAAGAA